MSTQLPVEAVPFERTKGWLEAYVHSLDYAGVQNFLRFVTGLATVRATSAVSDEGEGSITIEIYTDPDGCTPTASTCARTLFLPAYETKEEFDRKLTLALDTFRAENGRVGGAAMRYQ